MTNFVLVHGTWTGGWQWRKTADLLRRAGHDVATPTLTGLGERAHLMSRDIDLETHIADIIGVIDCDRLDDVALVAHSYGGMVASAVADRRADRIGALILIDAAKPEDGQAMLDFVTPERKQTVLDLARDEGEGYMVPNTLVLETGITDAAERDEFLARTGPHPLASLLQPIRLSGKHLGVARKAYVVATLNNSHHFQAYHDWAAAQDDWDAAELASHHFPMASMPEETAKLLQRLTARMA
ncbi:MAG: alpha/beta hydrolase [Alphaproteobacteria bacterium]